LAIQISNTFPPQSIHKEDYQYLKLVLDDDSTYFRDAVGRTVAHMAAEQGALQAMKLILQQRKDAVHDQDKNGRTPLHWAAACGGGCGV